MKALIIAYHFPPLDTIVSSHRAASWFDEFPKKNTITVVITRHWTKEPVTNPSFLIKECLNPIEVVKHQNNKIYHLPFRNSSLFKLSNINIDGNYKRVRKRFLEIIGLFSGKFTNEVDVCFAFYPFLKKIISVEKPDVIIATVHPISTLRLAWKLNKKYKIPIIVDFRDHWNNLIFSNFKFSLRAKFYFFIQKKWIQYFLRNVSLISAVNNEILKDISKICNAPGILLHNGFEESIFKNIEPIKYDIPIFKIALIGVVYHYHCVDLIIDGINQFIEKMKSKKNFQFQFIGQEYFKDVADKIKSNVNNDYLLITNRIVRKKALGFMKQAEILFYSGIPDAKGIYSGKIFEYLASNKNIVIFPGDGDVLDELMKETQAGTSVNSPEAFSNYLLDKYKEWSTTHNLKYYGNQNVINKYNRSFQARYFLEKILETIPLETNKK